MSQLIPDPPTRSVTAIVAEDEANLRDELCEALAGMWPELRICAAVGDGLEAQRAWQQWQPDILFLDIEMPGRSGLDIARSVSGQAHVVFITAYDRYAVAAFECGAVDYVIKPFENARLAAAIARLQNRRQSAPARIDGLLEAIAARVNGTPQYLRWITASIGKELRLITSEEICYFQADQKCTVVVTADHQSVIYTPIKDLVLLLDPAMFWQVHRSTIVSVRQIARISRNLRGQLFLELKHCKDALPVSARYAHLFRQM